MRKVRWVMLNMKVYALQARVKLRVIKMILRGESVCYRTSFLDQVTFGGEDPAMIECSFYEEGGKWRYTRPYTEFRAELVKAGRLPALETQEEDDGTD